MGAALTIHGDKPLTFFRGKTFDGHPWVLSFEGGPTATEPTRRGMVTGYVGSARVRATISRGSELRSLLPGLTLKDAKAEIARGV